MKTIALLGNGEVLLKLIEFIKKETSYDMILIGYAPRHARELSRENKKYEDVLVDYKERYKQIELIEMENLDCEGWRKICNSSMQISLGSAWIYKKRHIDMAPFLVHSHCTNLPKYRGGASSSWMLMSKHRKSAITIFRINERVDAGDLLVKNVFYYPEELISPAEYSRYTSKKLQECMEQFILRHESGIDDKIARKIQEEEDSTYFPRLSSSVHSWINWTWDADEIVSFIRAFSEPYKGAMTRITAKQEIIMNIYKAEVIEEEEKFHPFKTGLIYRKIGKKLYVACREKTIKIQGYELSNDSGKGDKPFVGDRLYTLTDDIDCSMRTRVFYTPS
ncbi:hypothetical protein [Prochlorococcus marinus]|uniref:hypothetical protein n=1 Tax=Prochlorococcus marinus TaxID=1219 RepID=UPI0007B3B3F5|nr:hypothetical protein [Prochlorococcus marinus]KZR73701.1 Methionyl-tRNA formyltransferase [Prochlorococcus marinus str. MIT 1320]